LTSGANTTKNGNSFESKTSNEPRLIVSGFTLCNIPSSKHTYLEKEIGNYKVRYLTQQHMKSYIQHIQHFTDMKFSKCNSSFKPDEAYVFVSQDNTKPNIIKIIEKKNQNTSGSVEDKLVTFLLFVEYYQRCFPTYRVEYAYCISDYLKQRYNSDLLKWSIVRDLFKKYNITVLYGDDDDYFDNLDKWLYQN